MVNVFYLVLVFTYSSGTTSIMIPQANMKQCQINAREQLKDNRVLTAKCIAGVK